MLDVAGALALLLLLSPVVLLAVLAVRATSAGPALYRQARTGRYGREFQILKFRTMRHDAEELRAALERRNEGDGHLFKMRDDPRVTPVGRLLRRCSLDEVPQLFNILRGDMSLVGPRPLPTADSHFDRVARQRLEVRPGLTGLGQISGRSTLSWQQTLRHDLAYVNGWSLRLDLRILLRTPVAVLRRTGAY